jgi:hypothetical protein
MARALRALVGAAVLLAATRCASAPAATRSAAPLPPATAALIDRLFRPCPACDRTPAIAALRQRGFTTLPAAHVLATYLPDHDRDGRTFDAEPWETEALSLQGRLFGGATSWPSRGSYRESDADGHVGEQRLIVESTRMIVSFASERDFSADALRTLADFLRRFKQQTGQDSVALVIDGAMYLY